PPLRAPVWAVGVAGIFVETHQDPDNAPSDGPNMVPLSWFKGFLEELKSLDAVAKARPNLHWFAESE
ncbi:MAG: 3-deoxy-8-phosphooctulonate synthase, partial [Pseudomonadota bacterium]